jgi:hypothetical protein
MIRAKNGKGKKIINENKAEEGYLYGDMGDCLCMTRDFIVDVLLCHVILLYINNEILY